MKESITSSHRNLPARENGFNHLSLQFNLPNSLTTVRVVFTLISAVLLFSGLPEARRWAGFILTMAWITDWLDGFLARRLGQTTLGGALFDLTADRLLMTGISVITVRLGFWQPFSAVMPAAPFPYLGLVWAGDLAVMAGVAVFILKRRRFYVPFPGPPQAARLAFPVQMATLILAVLGIAPPWVMAFLMYLTIGATLLAAVTYIKKGGFVFTARG
jgi:phosphatidylglycerophosphate synthase